MTDMEVIWVTKTRKQAPETQQRDRKHATANKTDLIWYTFYNLQPANRHWPILAAQKHSGAVT